MNHPCNTRPMLESGYTSCDCPDCFETAIGSEGDEIVLCSDCDDAGCDGESACERDLEQCDCTDEDHIMCCPSCGRDGSCD